MEVKHRSKFHLWKPRSCRQQILVAFQASPSESLMLGCTSLAAPDGAPLGPGKIDRSFIVVKDLVN